VDRRRFLLTSLAGVLARPVDGDAQQAGTIPRIGYLSGSSQTRNDEAFRQGMRELGYIEGQNVTIEYRFADGKYEQLPRLASDLVRMKVAVVVVATTPAIRAAQQATQTIPIVMVVGEPAAGTIVSLARPGGNITGVSTINTELSGKRLELLKESTMKLSRVAVLYNPTNPISASQLPSIEAAARALVVQLQLLGVKNPQDFKGAFDAAVRGRADAIMGLPDQMFNTEHKRVANLALKHRLPTMYWAASYAESGGLMSYGPNVPEMYRRGASYVDRILKGANAAELPVEQPTKFVFAINLKTAKALGLTIPPSVLARADQVIE
jgi:putative tryptophan/tyrosine transport system substrate-binding protein